MGTMLGLSARSLSNSTRLAARSSTAVRYASSKGVIETLAEVIPERQEIAKKLRAEHGDKGLGEIKVENVFGGMRGLKVMLWEPSVLDANEGIRFWGKTIPECQEALPKAPGGKQMLPESMLFYLLTGKVPSQQQADDLVAELAERSAIPKFLEDLIDSFPKSLHPMTQFVMATAALNHDSKFAAAYSAGMKKSEYWKSTAEDVLDLSAKAYPIAARIYRNKYMDGGKNVPALDKQKQVGNDVPPEKVKEYIWSVLKSGRVIPGYGHAVLRKPDPRFMALQQFAAADKEIAQDPIFKLANSMYEVAPGVLTEHGKTKNPFPNVDAASGMLLYHYGLTQFEYYTVIFGVSRAMASAQLVWDRAYGLPIERPKSMSVEGLAKFIGA